MIFFNGKSAEEITEPRRLHEIEWLLRPSAGFVHVYFYCPLQSSIDFVVCNLNKWNRSVFDFVLARKCVALILHLNVDFDWDLTVCRFTQLYAHPHACLGTCFVSIAKIEQRVLDYSVLFLFFPHFFFSLNEIEKPINFHLRLSLWVSSSNGISYAHTV